MGNSPITPDDFMRSKRKSLPDVNEFMKSRKKSDESTSPNLPTPQQDLLRAVSKIGEEGLEQGSHLLRGVVHGVESIPSLAYGGALGLPFSQPQEQFQAGELENRYAPNSPWMRAPLYSRLFGEPEESGEYPENIQALGQQLLEKIPFVKSAESLISPKKPFERAETTGEIIGQVAPFIAGGAALEEVAGKPKFSPEKGFKNLLKGGLSGTGPEFQDLHDELKDSGHLTNLVENPKYDISNAKNATHENKILRNYLNDWWDTTIQPAIDRHPNETIKGNDFIPHLSSLLNPVIDSIMPERAQAIQGEMNRFSGKEIPLSDARELLSMLNSANASVEDASPEDAAGILRKSGTKAALDKSTETLRDLINKKLESLDEKGIARANKEYGLVKEFKNKVYDNIQRSNEAEAKKPQYRDVPYRTMSRHKILGPVALAETVAGAGGPGGRGLGAAVLPALAGFEAVDVHGERASTPNALRKAAYNAYRGGPSVKTPTYEPSPEKPIQGELTPLITPKSPQLPSQTIDVEPIETKQLKEQKQIKGPFTDRPMLGETKGRYAGLDDESLKVFHKVDPNPEIKEEMKKRGLLKEEGTKPVKKVERPTELKSVKPIESKPSETKPKEVKPVKDKVWKRLLDEEHGTFEPGKIKDYINDEGWLTSSGEFIPKVMGKFTQTHAELAYNTGLSKSVRGRFADQNFDSALRRGHVAFRIGSSSPRVNESENVGYFEGYKPDKNTMNVIRHGISKLHSGIKQVSIGVGEHYLPPSSRGEALRWLESLTPELVHQ